MHMGIILSGYMYVHHMNPWCLCQSEERFRYPETRVMDDCDPLCECWILNPEHVWEQ